MMTFKKNVSKEKLKEKVEIIEKSPKKDEKKKEKKSNSIGILLCSVILGIVAFMILLSAEKRSLANYATQKVVVAIDDININTEITSDNVSKYFKIVDIDSDRTIDAAFSTLNDIIVLEDSFTNTSIIKNEQISNAKFKTLSEYEKNLVDPVEISFKTTSFDYAVGGSLRRGDVIIVDIINKYTGNSEVVLKNVVITSCYDASGNLIEQSDTKKLAVAFKVKINGADVADFNKKIENGSIRLEKL